MTSTINTTTPKITKTARAAKRAVNGAEHPSAAQPSVDDAKYAQAQQDFADAGDDLWATFGAFWKPQTGTTTIVKFVAKVVLYALGAVATAYAVSALSTAMLAGGVPLFVIMVCEIIGFILGIVASVHVADLAVNYVADGKLSRDFGRLTAWIGRKVSNTSTFVKQSMARAEPSVH